MLPPIVEIYVVWHPGDSEGATVADEVVRHFHGTPFTGLVGGAVAAYPRSRGLTRRGGVPQSIPFPGTCLPNGLAAAKFVAVVPVLGRAFARAVDAGTGAGSWWDYATMIKDHQVASADRVGIFPVVVDRRAADEDRTELGRILGQFQGIGGPSSGVSAEARCQYLAQGIAQLAGGVGGQRLTVFISHTRNTQGEPAEVRELISLVRKVIGRTTLGSFFDVHDIQPGAKWADKLREYASKGALLAVRTDLYASRKWCQEEMLIAKREGMPIIILNALGRSEERGSFLMDHVPRVPVRRTSDGWVESDIRVGVDILVDECLKRVLWHHQREVARERPGFEISWWAPHAPEPATFAAWLAAQRQGGRLRRDRQLRILYPDPPLGEKEKDVISQMVEIIGMEKAPDLVTPRLLAARGGDAGTPGVPW